MLCLTLTGCNLDLNNNGSSLKTETSADTTGSVSSSVPESLW